MGSDIPKESMKVNSTGIIRLETQMPCCMTRLMNQIFANSNSITKLVAYQQETQRCHHIALILHPQAQSALVVC